MCRRVLCKEWAASTLAQFLAYRPFSIVHVDAPWDSYREAMAEKIHGIIPQFESSVTFGYLDCDADKEYARDIGIRNVPSVAYYSGAKLVGVVIGLQQDIASNIERIMRGEALDNSN